MLNKKLFSKFSLALMLFTQIPGSALALTLSEPTAGGTTVNACDDYFTSKWAHRIDMNNNTANDPDGHEDTLYNFLNLGSESQDLNRFSCSNGICSTTTTGLVPFFRLTTPTTVGELIDGRITRFGALSTIDPATYKLLTFRMYSSEASYYSVRWDTDGNPGSGYTTLLNTYPGYHTYQIDLSSATIGASDNIWSTGSKNGLGIYPARNSSLGTTVNFDWIQLTPASNSCSTFNVEYTGTNGVPVSLFIDDNTDPTDGYQVRSDFAVANGSATDVTFNTSWLYSGTYNVVGFESSDFATHYLDPWDMDDSGDVNTDTYVQIDNPSFSGGQLCGSTTGSDPSFRLKQPGNDSAIDSSTFRYLTLSVSGLTGDFVQVVFFDETLAALGIRTQAVAADGVVTFDMADSSGGGNAGAWTGSIGAIRIDPGTSSGKNFCINWVALGPTAINAQPTVPAMTAAAGTVTVSDRLIAPIFMPDKFGGRDYFTVNGNPRNFDSTNDVALAQSAQNVLLHPGGAYTDNAGDVYTDDFISLDNLQSGSLADGDPHFFVLLRELTNPIDASLYRLACVTMTLPETAQGTDHTVLRFGWENPAVLSGGTGRTSDDIVLRTTAQGTYCTDLKVAAIEEGGVSLTGDYWADPAQSNQVISFRVDPHERDLATAAIVSDIRLAARHEADQQYAIVVKGDRTASVGVYKNTTQSTSGGTLIGTLSANRTSDVLLWDTSAEVDGAVYYIYTTISGNSYVSPHPVVINHSFSDSTDPILSLDAPPADNSGRYETLDLAGHALDNVRLANVRALIDSTLVESFLPNEFRLDVRNTYSTLPFSSTAGFQKAIDLTSFAAGSHTLTVIATDTAGRTTTITRTFTKANSTLTSPVTYTTPNEPTQTIETDNSEAETDAPVLGVKLKATKGLLTFTASAVDTCMNLSLYANSTRAKLQANNGNTLLYSWTSPDATEVVTAPKLSRLPVGKIFFKLTCDSTDSSIKYTSLAKVISTKTSSSVSKSIRQIDTKIR